MVDTDNAGTYDDGYVDEGPVEYAGFLLRFVAYIIDAILVSILTWILMAIMGAVGLMSAGGFSALADLQTMDEPSPEMMATIMGIYTGMMGASLIGGWLYYAIMESSHNQGTLGKMALSLKVTDLNGERITFLRATGRFFGKIVSSLIFLIGYIMIAFTPKKQGLHDMMASCLVLRKPR